MRSRLSTGLWLAASLVLAGCAQQPITVVGSRTMTELRFRLGQGVPQSHFSLQDTIRVAVYVTWPDASRGDGRHDVDWKWYRSDVLVSVTRRKTIDFESTPFTLWSRRVAASLGPGHYRVDTLIDGKVTASDDFTIDPV